MTNALYNFILKTADDCFVLGHRNSEWTGLGPFMEEDISFASMAQDKIGHAWMMYKMLFTENADEEAEKIAFRRNEKDFTSCHLVEMPIGEYDFSLMRHFLFDHADQLRYETLMNSSFEPLAHFSKKFKGELKFHTMHADTFIIQLGNGNEESKARMQSALNECMPLAFGIFESYEGEEEIVAEKIFISEKELQQNWLAKILPIIEQAGLKMPDLSSIQPIYGGRKGYHSEHLQPLLNEMREVVNQMPDATQW
ncbi:MAG: phenylacetate-CoA oxygenase subunit PaaC [Bacteroidota bacterium]